MPIRVGVSDVMDHGRGPGQGHLSKEGQDPKGTGGSSSDGEIGKERNIQSTENPKPKQVIIADSS